MLNYKPLVKATLTLDHMYCCFYVNNLKLKKKKLPHVKHEADERETRIFFKVSNTFFNVTNLKN